MREIDSIECPRCGMSASPEAWDEETRISEGENITEIEEVLNGDSEEPAENYVFTCPYCTTNISGDRLIVHYEEEDE